MGKKILQMLSLVLSLALLIQLLPVNALALEVTAQDQVTHIEEIVDEPETDDPEIPDIFQEDVSCRREFSKEFVMNGGLRMAVVYGEPVHYQHEGQWEEIDNTLKSVGTTYTNTAGPWQVSFPRQLSKSNAVSITKDGYTLRFYMAGELRSGGDLQVMSAATPDEALDTTAQPLHAATAQVHSIDWTEEKAKLEHPETLQEKLRSSLSYSGVYTNTDIIYDLQSNQVKESIVMGAYSSGLQGYRYTLNVGTLNPVLTDSGEIHLYDRDKKKIVMVMPAPFLVDNAGETSYDVTVSLTGSGSLYTLTYRLPQQWLADSSRQWPVVLDPVVEGNTIRTNIGDVTLYEIPVNLDYNTGALEVGYMSTRGRMRTFLKFKELPELSSANVVINAQLTLFALDGSSAATLIEAHKVPEVWESNDLTWAENHGMYEETIEDYSGDQGGGYSWNITDIARQWYEEENTGLMLKAPDSVEADTSSNHWMKFVSSDYYSSGYTGERYLAPLLQIVFRNSNGLESYWDYTALSAGRAGAGYINSYTGNLVWTHSDIGFGGNRMPVSISHIYNASDCERNSFGLGKGWRTNYHQNIKYVSDLAQTYYAWEDSDGTKHYFYQDEGTSYKDEDGLELTLTKTGTADGDLSCTITDKQGNTSYFDSLGRLYKLENNQKDKSNILITYDSGTYRITRITDGVGRKYNFTYTDLKYLDKISYTGAGSTEITYVSFYYYNGFMTRIYDKDGKFSRFTYANDRLLYTAEDVDGYKLIFDYTNLTAGKPNRISEVKEQSNSTSKVSMTIAYAHNQTTFTDIKGNQQIIQFNNWGNTTSVQDGEGRAQFAGYASNDKSDGQKGNQLILSSKLQNTVGNMLSNSSFEGTALWTSVNGASQMLVAAAYLGNQSLQLTKAAGTTAGGVKSTGFTAEPGATYTFSAYLKTGTTSSAYLTLGPDASVVSETLPASQDWTRMEVSYTNSTATNVTVYAQVLTKTGGSIYIDCVQLEKAETASRYNIVQNGDFRYGEDSWIRSEYCTAHGAVTGGRTGSPTLEKTIFKMVGIPEHKLRIRQRFSISGQEGDTFVLAGWAKGQAVPLTDEDRTFSIRGTFYYTNGETDEFAFDFNPDTDVWQYTSGVMVAQNAYTEIKVEFLYDYNANDVYFDGMQLFKEEFGASYTYDDDGNVTSVKDIQRQITDYEYSSNGTDLLKVIQNNKAKVTYTYDDYHNVKTATTQEGVVYSFTYDDYGNNTSVSIESDGKKITTTAQYSTDNANRLVSTTDSLGNKTTYGYNADTNVLEWVQYPEDTEATRTEYTYDQMYRLAQTELTTNSGLDLSASYTYVNDQLTKITTPSTTYNFTYGNFGLCSSVKVGTTALANYSYETTTNWLTSLAYGNGDVVQYTYDNQGRTTKQTYEDGTYVTFKYDNSGALARVYDSQSYITTTYYYDFTDRLMKRTDHGSIRNRTVTYSFDQLNNLTERLETVFGVNRRTNLSYDDDNRVTGINNGSIHEAYTYDAYGRLQKIATDNAGTAITNATYAYQTTSGGAPTDRVSQLVYSGSGYNKTVTYAYDDNGNLTTVNNGGSITGYTYDSANQLRRENNQAAGKTWVWTYDNAGNILTRKEYAYTTGTVGAVLDQVNYTYGDSNWGDKLTAFDGQTITYDAIGNPLNDGTWTYTWQHGRELLTMEKNSAVTITQQPEDCVYTPGGSASFAVTASGTGLTYRWQFSTDNGDTWVNSANATANTRVLYMTTVSDFQLSVIWRCIVTDATGHTAVTQTAGYRNTTSTAPLVITNQPDNVYCAICDSAQFTTAASGTGLYCRWQYSPDGGVSWHNSGKSTAIYGTLTIDAVDEYHMSLLWRCKVMDGGGNVAYSRIVSCKRSTTRWRNVYDLDGLRAKRTNGETTYLYTYLDGQLTHMKVDGQHYYFTYDPNGTPVAMTWNGKNYYYVTNLQGDITHILDNTGAVVTSYVYNAWGKLISTTGTLASTVGRYNPLRYRGYVYDTETGLYYVSSRYYDPEIGRWINTDNQIAGVGGEFLGYDMFAYCFNNPVNMDDPSGNWPEWIKNAVKWAAENVAKPIVKKVQAALAETDFTYSTGIGAGGSITGYGAQVQGGISFDSKGNVAIQGTFARGFSTTGGWSGIAYNSISNAPDVSALEGAGYQAGGLYGWNIGYVPVVAGGDINFIPKPDSEGAYLGGTFTTGFGSPGFEGHVDWTHTGTLPYSKINIFDCAENIYHAIMEW